MSWTSIDTELCNECRPEDHKVLSTLILGYPKFKYLRAVDRDPMRVKWL
jgi:hypothetical protein